MTDSSAPPPPLFKRLLRALRALVKNNWDWRFRGVNPRRRRIVLDRSSFDADYYIQHNPDVLERGTDPFLHFLTHGLYENRKARFFDTHWYMGRYADLRHGRLDAYAHFRLLGAQENRTGQFISFHTEQVRENNNNYKEWIDHFDTLGKLDIKYLETDAAALSVPALCVVVIDRGVASDGHALAGTLSSILSQIRPADEVWLVGPASSHHIKDAVAELGARAESVRIREAGDNPAGALNAILAETGADYVMAAEAGANLSPAALYWFAKALAANPEAEVLYSDEDCLDAEGRRTSPNFKPEPNADLMLTHDVFGHLTAYRTEFLRLIGGYNPEAGDAFEYDLALRASENTTREMTVHIARILYHGPLHHPRPASAAHLQAVRNHLERRNLTGEVRHAPEATGFSRVQFTPPEPAPLVSIIIPTRDRLDILRVCVSSLVEATTYPSFEIIIVDNGSVNPETLAYLEEVSQKFGVVVLRDPRPFNFSALNNVAVEKARGDYVCLMNNDIEVLTPGWLEEMMAFARQPDVGCVGARLWYPDGTLQHGGVLIGFHGVAGHLHKALPRGESGYGHRAALHQNLSAVTAACLLVRKSIYEEVGGLDEAFAVAFNDVDFCLKVREAGYRNVYTPYAEMIHHESASRGSVTSPKNAARELAEVNLIKSRWQEKLHDDPAYNPNLTLTLEDLSLAWPPRIPTVTQLRSQASKSGGTSRRKGFK
ncbi:glycosyltransferase family 2 protein [Asticcacaulis solisilvae]|uniref:glycosyltransferase family 2 protein n=1 Tax=Asticcacaulis solisilvae TaxID=1217274 RepID=UPI003FD6FA63